MWQRLGGYVLPLYCLGLLLLSEPPMSDVRLRDFAKRLGLDASARAELFEIVEAAVHGDVQEQSLDPGATVLLAGEPERTDRGADQKPGPSGETRSLLLR
jgi:hypothetical protein